MKICKYLLYKWIWIVFNIAFLGYMLFKGVKEVGYFLSMLVFIQLALPMNYGYWLHLKRKKVNINKYKKEYVTSSKELAVILIKYLLTLLIVFILGNWLGSFFLN